MFRRLVATSRAPQIMVLSMLKSFGKIWPQIDQIWAWLSRGHRWSPGVRNPLKSLVTGPSLLVNCYLEIKFHKIIRVNPHPPPPPPLNQSIDYWRMFGRETPDLQGLALNILLYQVRPVVVNPTAARASICQFSKRKNCFTIERAEKLVYIH